MNKSSKFLAKINEASKNIARLPEVPGIVTNDWLVVDNDSFDYHQKNMMLLALHSSNLLYTTSEHSSDHSGFVDFVNNLAKHGKQINWSGDGNLFMVTFPDKTKALVTTNTAINFLIIANVYYNFR